MADSSTNTALILYLIAEDCWARRHLRRGQKDVSVTSEPLQSPTIIGDMFIGTLVLREVDVRFLHDSEADSRSDCGRWLGSMPASQSYKVHLPAIFIH